MVRSLITSSESSRILKLARRLSIPLSFGSLDRDRLWTLSRDNVVP